MRSKTITELNELVAPAAVDLLVIYDVSAGETKKIKASEFTSAGGGYQKITATGIVDDSNVQFTFIQRPGAININGGLYGEGDGVFAWTWDEPTLTATLAIPVGTAGFIHGVL